MRNKRTLFARYSLTTKEQLLHAVKDFLNYYQQNGMADEEWSIEKVSAVIKTVEAFYRLLQKTALPDLREWWYYYYKITRNAVELEMCHCSDVEYSILLPCLNLPASPAEDDQTGLKQPPQMLMHWPLT